MSQSSIRAGRTPVQLAASAVGAVFLLVGVLGFIPGITTGYDDMTVLGHHSGAMLLGLFAVSVLHNVVHLLFGVWGLWAGRSSVRSLAYALGSGAAYLLLGVLGIFTNSLFGIVPIGGYDVHLHLVLAGILAGCGFVAMWLPSEAPASEQVS